MIFCMVIWACDQRRPRLRGDPEAQEAHATARARPGKGRCGRSGRRTGGVPDDQGRGGVLEPLRGIRTGKDFRINKVLARAVVDVGKDGLRLFEKAYLR